jgi:hypothetical protein
MPTERPPLVDTFLRNVGSYKSHISSHPRRRHSLESSPWKSRILHSVNWLGSVVESNVSPVKYKQGLYIPEDDILHSHRRENLESYIALTGWTLYQRPNVSPVKYELGLYIPEDDILHIRFEVFTALTMKNGIVWDVTPCGSCKNRRFGET